MADIRTPASEQLRKVALEERERKLIPINENEELEEEYEVDFYPHLVLANKGKTKHYLGATEIKKLYESII